MPSCKRIFAASLLLICLGYGLHILFTPSQPLRFDQQVYIWQRVWTAEHNEALKRSRPLFSTLRVLGMQFHPQEGIRHFTVNTSLIKQDGRPVWLSRDSKVSLHGLITSKLSSIFNKPYVSGKKLVLRW